MQVDQHFQDNVLPFRKKCVILQIDNLYIVLTNLPEYSSVCSSRDICQKSFLMNHNILPCILTACSFALNVNGQELYQLADDFETAVGDDPSLIGEEWK